jgi:type II secretory pathway pseudopilin PulG
VKSRKLSPGAQIALVVVGLLAVAAAGYFLVLAPKRTSAADVQRQIEALHTQIDSLRQATAASSSPPPPPVDVSELFRLSKAMPDRTDMASVILELNRIAKDTGITFESITPQVAFASEGYQIVPIDLAFQGDFYSLSDFLFRLRSLVAVRDGGLSANGRLFNVQSVAFGAGEASFPQLKASVTVNAFVFGEGDPAATQVVPPDAAAGEGQAEGGSETPAEGGTETPTDPSAPPPPPTVSAAPAAGAAS